MPRANVTMEHLLRATARSESRHFWFRGFRAFVTPLLRRAVRSRRGKSEHNGRDVPRLLDCGCGTGANLALLNRFGCSYGFDVSLVGLRTGHALGRRHLACASVTAAPFPTGVFDIVTSFDVLYSLDDGEERSAFAEMHRLLRPGGFAVINVAAFESLRGDHSVLSHEVRRYTRSDLRDRLISAGFTIVRMTYTNASLFLPMLVARSLQRRRGLRQEEDAQREIAVPAAPVNAILTVVLLLESLWLRWFSAPVGSSLLCLARKPEDQLTTVADGARI